MKICKICLKKVMEKAAHSDYHKKCLTQLLSSAAISPILPFSRSVFQSEISKNYTKGMSISGVQKKLSLKLGAEQLELTNTHGAYILKPSVEDFPELAENEHLSMLIGKALDIETPPLGLLKFSDGELVYIIKRFDGPHTQRLHVEDMASIFNLHRDENYKYSQSYEAVGTKLKKITGGKLTVVLDFFNRLICNFIIENNDYHLKNISVIAAKLTKEGFYDSLSPNYDSIMTRMYFPGEQELALDLLKDDNFSVSHKNTGFYTRPDFEELGAKIGLPPAATAVIFSKIKERKNELFELVSASFLSMEKKKFYLEHLAWKIEKLE